MSPCSPCLYRKASEVMSLVQLALSSMGKPWQSQPGLYTDLWPCSSWNLTMKSFRICTMAAGCQDM